MNFFCNLFIATVSMTIMVCAQEPLARSGRRFKQQKVAVNLNQTTTNAFDLPATQTTTTLPTTGTAKIEEANAKIKDVNDDSFMKLKNSTTDERMTSESVNDENGVITSTEVLKKVTRPTRNNQALFSALKKRRKEAYLKKNYARKSEDPALSQRDKAVESEDQTLDNHVAKSGKKSSTYSNKKTKFGTQDKKAAATDEEEYLSKEENPTTLKPKRRRFSVKV